ncbi:MAG: hypothetical protein DCF31_06805 [Alphaproteobacteria bacterium]|nr:MAG: hypothetical protein DCF31_06805 [Alphaproteobacteria bacterium]
MDSNTLFDRDDTSARQGNRDLIASDRVRGTEVYNRGGEKLGSIDSILIDKVSGQVSYVVMSFGGFLGIGEKFHPLPWDVLTYDTQVGGYSVDLDRGQLEGAPSYGREDVDNFDYGSQGSSIDNYYGREGNSRQGNSRQGDSQLGHGQQSLDQQGVGNRGGRSPDYDNSESGRPADREPPKGFYSPEAQSERTSDQGVKTHHEGTETADGGFYSPEQQAARNQHEQDRSGLAGDPRDDLGEPNTGRGKSDRSWDDPDRAI